MVRPTDATLNNDLTQYTFAISKFIVGHKIKVQTDFSLLQEATKADTYLARLQFELSL